MNLCFEQYGLNQEPFELTPDPAFYYASQNHATALEWAKIAIEQREVGLVVGESGSGKTMLAQLLIDSLVDQPYKICLIRDPHLSATTFLREICTTLFDGKLPSPPTQVVTQITTGLAELFDQGIQPVIIIDAAQTIQSKTLLDDLDLLANIHGEDQNIVSILLFGRPEFAHRLKHSAYTTFVEKIRYSITLKAFNEKETKYYLLHRLQVAGFMKSFPFTEDAVAFIWQASRGLPREINHMGSLSLKESAVAGVSKITAELVNSALADNSAWNEPAE